VAFKPESKYAIYAVGNDKTLKEIENGKEKYPRYESNVNISQIVLLHGGSAILAGVAEDERPGSI